jgi:hypothetical protein
VKVKRAAKINSANKTGRLSRGEWWLTIFLAAFCLLFTLVELNNHRLWTSDFQVYYEATRDFFAGNNPYVHNYGLDTGYFKYTPFTLYLFSPHTLVSFGAGQFIHLALLSLSLIVSFTVLRRLTEKYVSAVPAGLAYLVFACVAIHLTRELHLGNINLLLLLLFTLGARSLLAGKDFPPALWWSLMLILKPIMILVVLPLILQRKWKMLAYMAGFGLFFLLFPALHVGWQGNIVLWQDWLKAISAHGEYLTSFNAIGTLVQVHTGFGAGWTVALLCLGIVVFLMVRQQLKEGPNAVTAFTWAAVFAAFVPNFFVTDTEHFLLSAPLLFLLLAELRNAAWYYRIGFALGMLCFAFNSTDLLGSELSNVVYSNGLLGIGNLLFLLTYILVRLNRKTTPLPSPDHE